MAMPWPDDPPEDGASVQAAGDGGPYCVTCRGARWLRLDRPLGSPEFASLVRCIDCLDTTAASARNVLARVAGLSDEQRRKTFQAFHPVRGSGQMVKLLSAFAANPEGWLVLHGRPGSGKTHLGLAVANALIQRLQQVVWWYVPDLVLRARELLLRGEGEYFAFLRELREATVLILDDLGATKPSEWAVQELLEPLFDHRYRHRLATLVTMIQDPAYQREHLSESIGRRFQDAGVALVIHHTAGQWSGRGDSAGEA